MRCAHAVRAGLVELGAGVTIAPDFQLKLHGTCKPQLRVGDRTHLDGRFVVRGRGFIEIGSDCSFRSDTYVGCVVGVSIGSHVFGAEGVFISDNNNHPVDPQLREAMTRTPMGSPLWSWTTEGVKAAPVVIEDNVWLGRHCAVLKGVSIGRDSVVALAAVVTRTVPAGSLVGGNPARVLKTLAGTPA